MGAILPIEAAQSNVGKYTLIEKLGEGYLGTVYRGFDQDLGRPVVVRILCDGIRWDSQLEDAFDRECREVAGLQHPNIAAVFEAGKDGQQRYIAMESLGSGTLANLIAQKSSLPVETRLSIMVQVAEGLSYAHKKGILHRDLNPGKIHLTPDGSVKIRDFSLAHVLMKYMPHPAVRFGAPIYLCPEQIQHAECDERADIFSAGTIFYELITYCHPFHDRDSNKALDNILSENSVPTFDKFPDAPPGIWMILKSCLARRPEERFASADELAKACRDLLKSLREDTQLMLGELYAALSPLKKAAAQPGASAATLSLLEETQRLLHGNREADYATLDRLMTLLMEQYPILQAVSNALPELGEICPHLPPEENNIGSQSKAAPAIKANTADSAPVPKSAAEIPPHTADPVKNSDGGKVKPEQTQSQVASPSPVMPPAPLKGEAAAGKPGADSPAAKTEERPANGTSGQKAVIPPPVPSGNTAADKKADSPPQSRSASRLARPTYRAAAVLLSLLVMAAAVYIVLGTEMAEPVRKAWDMLIPGSVSGDGAEPAGSLSRPGGDASGGHDGDRAGISGISAGANITGEASTPQPAHTGETDPALRQSVGRVYALINSGKLQMAKMEIDRLQQIYPAAPEIPVLRRRLQAALSKQTQEQSRQEAEQQSLALKQKEDEWNRQVNELIAGGRYSDASGVLTAWIAQNPSNSTARELNDRVQEIQRQLNAFNGSMSENRYPDALNALVSAEKLNPADPNFVELRRQVEAKKAAARAILTVQRLGAGGVLLLDGKPVGKDGEIEGESIPIGRHTIAVESNGIPIASRTQDFSEGQRVVLAYDLVKQNMHLMTDADRDIIARRKSIEAPERFIVEHEHGIFRGSCRGAISLDSLDVAYSPESGSHGFRIPFKLLKLKTQGKSASLHYISDNTHFHTFKLQDAQAADQFRQKWDNLKSLLR